MNTPYNTGKIQIGKYYQKPTYVEIDDDMIRIQGWLIGESKEARMNRIAKRIYMGLVVFLILFLMFATSAKAGAIASMPNEGGGKIVLTDETCKHDGKTYKELNRAYNYTTAGYSSEGCYFIEDETVVVVWALASGAKRMRYPAENFTLIRRSKGTQI